MVKRAPWVVAVAIGGAVLGALFVVMAAIGFLVVRAVDDDSRAWSNQPLGRAEARDRFGVERLPKVVLETQREEGGFQDAYFNVLLRIPPADVDAFLAANGLTRDAEGRPPEALEHFEARLRATAKPHGALRVTPLTGDRVAHLADGGEVLEFRNLSLLEFDDQLWVALETFET